MIKLLLKKKNNPWLKDYKKNGNHCLAAWYSVFSVRLGRLDQPIILQRGCLTLPRVMGQMHPGIVGDVEISGPLNINL